MLYVVRYTKEKSMKFLQGIKAKLADGAAARSLGNTSDAVVGGGDAEKNANTTTTDLRPPLTLGPFAFPSSSSYPSLYGEANDMICLSNLVYVLADMRDSARGADGAAAILGESSAERILSTPLPLVDAVRIVATEAEGLKARLSAETHAATLAALASLTTTKATSTGTTTTTMNDETLKGETAANDDNDNTGGLFHLFASWCGVGSGLGGGGNSSSFDTDEGAIASGGGGGEPLLTSTITAVGDAKSENELVYAIGVNPQKRRITVIFRGSVTTADFVVDSRIGLVRAKHPRRYSMINDSGSSSSGSGSSNTNDDDGNVGIHQGFYEYLMSSGKYVEIMKHLEQLVSNVPIRKTYMLYITGHSLGGALATLFGFYASCCGGSSGDTSSSVSSLPITIVSVASPRVGNIAFARAFVELESLGKLRHLRIANHKDPVTLNPTVSAKRALALSAKMFSPLGYLALMVTGNGEGGEEEVYYHTGMKMKLRKDICPLSEKQYEIAYSGAPFVAAVKMTNSTRSVIVVDNNDEQLELAEIVKDEQAKKKKSSSSDMINVAYHFGDAYTERILAVKTDLMGMSLNDLYSSKARDML